MEQPGYAVIELDKEEPDIKLPVYIKILPPGLRRAALGNYIFKKLPINKEIVETLGISGLRITLPYTYKQLSEHTDEEITSILNRIIIQEDVQNIVVDKRLEKYLDMSIQIDGRLIPYLMLEESLAWIRRSYEIPRKEMKLILIDSGDVHMEYVLDKLIPDLNYLVIVTEREDFFEDMAGTAFEEYGLMISVIQRPLSRPLSGNIILDLSDCVSKDYRNFPRDAVLLDFARKPQKTKDLLAHRKDIKYYNGAEVSAQGKIVDNRLLQAVICGQSSWLGKGQLKNFKRDSQKYNLELDRLRVCL